jgi:two-component system OmpR family sensor kinase
MAECDDVVCAVQLYASGKPFVTGESDRDPKELPGIRGALGARHPRRAARGGRGAAGVLMTAAAAAHAYGEADLHFLGAVAHCMPHDA